MITVIKKGVGFLKRNLTKYPGYLFNYGLMLLIPRVTRRAHFFNDQNFVQATKKRSVIRIGDGEIGLLHGISIGFQKHSSEIEADFKKLITSYQNTSPYILSVPVFVNYSNKELRALGEGKLNCWLGLKAEYENYFNKKAAYADAHFFYHKEKMLHFFRENVHNKKILLISEEKTIANAKKFQSETSFFKTLECIITPSAHSYEEKKEISQKIDNITKETQFDIIIMSCGPLGKVLTYEYARRGILCYDIGFSIVYLWDTNDYSHRI